VLILSGEPRRWQIAGRAALDRWPPFVAVGSTQYAWRCRPAAADATGTDMRDRIRYLLLQMRNADDPMRTQEVGSFARALDCSPRRIGVFDLLTGVPTRRELDAVDMVLLGGSGDYSVAAGGPWLEPALEAMRELYDWRKPTFASCWGFQAMARALGGEVVTDLSRAELGTHAVRLTEAGKRDPVFGPLAQPFGAVMGHQDIVTRPPEEAVVLASTDRVKNQAFTFRGRPIYCTQFHPELDRQGLLERLNAYPSYVQKIAGVSLEEFAATSMDAPQTESLLLRFVSEVLG
jgi:GMP synthase (glutamine-hydrolysing)